MFTRDESQTEIKRLVERSHRLQEAKRELTEEETKQSLILPLFKALNWETEDPFEVSAEETISKKRVDYGFRIDGIPQFFLEAKSTEVKLDSDDAKQAMNYSWLKSTTWAILTNFKELRVYNAEWQSQSTLDKLFFTLTSDEFISQFDKLWLLSRDAFLADELDSRAEEWGKKRKRTPVTPVLDQLFDDLVTWRQKLTKDISNNRANSRLLKSNEDLDESVQRIIDRLIFIRVCEDRRIEPKSLSSRLREWKLSPRNRSFYSLLVDVFREYDATYDSNIFAEHISEKLEINDLLLNTIILALYESKDHLEYDFAAIDADVLGDIYEQYLGFMLEKRKKGAIVTESYEQRRKFGTYYTPPYIVKFIIQNTLSTLFGEKPHPQRITILDPSCGSGSFLIEALSSMITHRNSLSFEEKSHTLTDAVFGVDLDPKAVQIAQLNLLLRILEKEKILPKLNHNIQCGNSIVDDQKAVGDKAFRWEERFSQEEIPFDVVIGNPPYVAWSEIESRRPLEKGKFLDLDYHCRPNHQDAQPNLYLFFLVRAISLTKSKLGFILPTEWLGANYAADFRDYLLNHANKITIYKFNPQYKVFTTHGTVGTNSLILIVDKQAKDKIVEQYQIGPSKEQEVKKALQNLTNLKKVSTYTSVNSAELIGKDWNILGSMDKPKAKISVPFVTLDNREYFEVVGGFQPPVDRIPNFQMTSAQFNNLPTSERNIVFPAVLNAHSIKKYVLEDEDRYWVIANDLSLAKLQTEYPTILKGLSKRIAHKSDDWWKFPNIRNMTLFRTFRVKLLSPRTASENSFAIDTNATLFKGTNTAIISKKLDPYFVAGVLNSKFANIWYAEYGAEYHGGQAKKYEPDKVRNSGIPIPLVPQPIQNRVILLVQEMLRLQQSIAETSSLSYSFERLTAEVTRFQGLIDEEVQNLYAPPPG